MNNYRSMALNLDRKNYSQAALYTGLIALALLLIVWFVKFYQPLPPEPPPQVDAVEINLGSSDVGSGNDQPQIPGEPAPAEQTAYTPPQTQTQAADEPSKDVEENNEAEAPPVSKPAATKPEAKEINKETKVVKTNTPPNNNPPAPPAPKPKAVLGRTLGGNGNGGNGAAIYKPGTGEGPGDGPGDKGSIGGNPNGKSYSPQKFPTKIVNIPSREFQDDFKESGKIALDLVVDENGRLVSATYQPNGSTITNRNQIEIAKRTARQLTYPKVEGGFIAKHIFLFEVK